MKHAFAVINPIAGNSDPDGARLKLATAAAAAGWTCEFYETTGEEELEGLVRQAVDDGAGLVIAVGGDGTVSEVAGGLVERDVPLGIVPAGTGNALAHDLGVPARQEEAIALLFNDHGLQRLDAMRTGESERYLVLNASVGVSAVIMADTKPEEKRRLGLLAYVREGLRDLANWQQQAFSLEIDGQRRRLRATEVAVLNSRSLIIRDLGNGEGVRSDDGHLDLFVVRARRVFDYAVLVWHVIRGLDRRERNIARFEVHHELHISTRQPLPLQGDGDVIGHTPVTIQVVPGALQVVVPAVHDDSQPPAGERSPVGIAATKEGVSHELDR